MFVEHKEQGEPSRELDVAPMKLSAAMRIGAKIRPQSHYSGFSYGRSCAIVAAAEGAGLDVVGHPEIWQITAKAWDFLWSRGIVDESFEGNSLAGQIIERNDRDSREAIADWLEAQGY